MFYQRFVDSWTASSCNSPLRFRIFISLLIPLPLGTLLVHEFRISSFLVIRSYLTAYIYFIKQSLFVSKYFLNYISPFSLYHSS
jgi:hypothetical protein